MYFGPVRVGAHMGPYGPLWAHVGPYGPIRVHKGPYGPLWTHKTLIFYQKSRKYSTNPEKYKKILGFPGTPVETPVETPSGEVEPGRAVEVVVHSTTCVPASEEAW